MREKQMEYFLIYRCCAGGYLFCPDFVQASVRAQHTYGPLELLGRVERTELDEVVAAVIERQVEEQLYALIPAEQVKALPSVINQNPGGTDLSP